LRELFTIFAIPETRDSPGADVVVLKAPLFSLETLGDMRHLGPRYVQRVARLWSALGFTPEHLVLVGYSLGIIPALDFVYASQGLKDFVPAEEVISLSGLIFGSAVADEALGYGQRASSLYRDLVENLWKLRQNLKPLEGNESIEKRLLTIHLNQIAWMRFLAHFSRDSVRHTEELRPLTEFGSSLLEAIDPQKVLQGMGFFGALLTENGQLVQAYNRNIRRWQLFLEQARIAVDQLSTRGRQKWFQERGPLPSSLKLISVSAMMPNEVLWDQSRSPVAAAFDPRMLDFQFIRENLRMNRDLTEIRHLDGWVGLGESRYDPLVSCRWAPAWCSARFAHEWWGVLNTDHWGLSIAQALPQREEIKHPFPRDVFLRAAARVLSSEDVR
jgi:hypothetical protein